MLTRIGVCLLLALTSGPSLFGADFAMKVTDKNYLDTQGFSVFLYDSTYHPVFVDQKNTAMEMILHGQRIATNGDVRLMPTPEQWDLVATLKGRQADKANNRLTANLAFPTFDLSYTLEVAAEPGGVKVSINLDKPLPEKLAGRAGFNLEFLPSIYMGKTYLVDGTKAGIFPRTPNDPMVKVLPLPMNRKRRTTWRTGTRPRDTLSRCRSPRARASRWGSTTRWPGSTSSRIRPTSCCSMDATARRTAGSCCVR